MNTLQFLGIHPDAIEYISELAESALTDCGATVTELNDMHESIQQKFFNGELDYKNLTNSLIYEYLLYAKDTINKKLPFAEVSIYANCDDSHLHINGTDYSEGDGDLGMMYDIFESIEITEMDEEHRKFFKEKGCPASYSLTINDSYAEDAIICSAYDEDEGKGFYDIFEDSDSLSMLLVVDGDQMDIFCYQDGQFFEATEDRDTEDIYKMIRYKLENDIVSTTQKNEIMHNEEPRSLCLVDNAMSRLSDEDFKSIDLSREEINAYFENTLSCRLHYENNEQIFKRVYEEYFKDIDWITLDNMCIDINYRKDEDIVTFSASAEKFITSEKIKNAYVESHDLKGSKGETIRYKLKN